MFKSKGTRRSRTKRRVGGRRDIGDHETTPEKETLKPEDVSS